MLKDRYNYKIEGIQISFLDEDGGGYYNIPLEEVLRYYDKITELEWSGIKYSILEFEKRDWKRQQRLENHSEE